MPEVFCLLHDVTIRNTGKTRSLHFMWLTDIYKHCSYLFCCRSCSLLLINTNGLKIEFSESVSSCVQRLKEIVPNPPLGKIKWLLKWKLPKTEGFGPEGRGGIGHLAIINTFHLESPVFQTDHFPSCVIFQKSEITFFFNIKEGKLIFH